MTHPKLAEFEKLNRHERESYLRRIEDSFAEEYKVIDIGEAGLRLPAFQHVQTRIHFSLIPGAEFTMGLSEKEEEAARRIADPPPFDPAELRQGKPRSVSSFLLSSTPMLVGAARKLFGDDRLSPYLKVIPENPYAPVYVARESALAMTSHIGCRLPYEIEWEYACRGNTQTLFIWGDRVPDEEELTHWLDFGLPTGQWRSNAFGLYQLFAGEWCMDKWTPSHSAAAPPLPAVYVIKGGASIFWPWQDQEWIWCMPAMRMPSTDITREGCSFRFLKELG